MNEYIKSRLSEEMILGQLMEECAELIKAAHKVILGPAGSESSAH